MPVEMIKGWRCYRCEHKWAPRDEEIPRVCPKCKSPYWDIPRGTKGNSARSNVNTKQVSVKSPNQKVTVK
ncbi:MAG: hypothetical protein QW303_09255 [Nitrososphaerota archaeon]